MGSNQMKTISFMNNNSLKGRLFFVAILIQSRLDYILAMRDFYSSFRCGKEVQLEIDSKLAQK